MKNAMNVGSFMTKKLDQLAKKTAAIKQVRGMGLLIGIEFSEPNAVLLKKKLFESGFLVGSIGDSVIRLAPPLILTKREAALFVDTLTAILETKTV